MTLQDVVKAGGQVYLSDKTESSRIILAMQNNATNAHRAFGAGALPQTPPGALKRATRTPQPWGLGRFAPSVPALRA